MVSGSGYTPNSPVDLFLDDLLLISVMTDGAGGFASPGGLGKSTPGESEDKLDTYKGGTK